MQLFMFVCFFLFYFASGICVSKCQICINICPPLSIMLLTTSFSFLLSFSFSSVCLDNCKHGACSLQGQCCHDQCLGGCSEPGNASSCVACRNLQHGNTCLEKCPPGYYVFRGWRCVSFSFCQVGINFNS